MQRVEQFPGHFSLLPRQVRPADYLKIDGLLVKNIANDLTDLAMVESINRIGHIMGLRTIAEFVENDAILAKLREIGVDYAQGFGLHMPEPL